MACGEVQAAANFLRLLVGVRALQQYMLSELLREPTEEGVQHVLRGFGLQLRYRLGEAIREPLVASGLHTQGIELVVQSILIRKRAEPPLQQLRHIACLI
jgi:hypothetical protein